MSNICPDFVYRPLQNHISSVADNQVDKIWTQSVLRTILCPGFQRWMIPGPTKFILDVAAWWRPVSNFWTLIKQRLYLYRAGVGDNGQRLDF